MLTPMQKSITLRAPLALLFSVLGSDSPYCWSDASSRQESAQTPVSREQYGEELPIVVHAAGEAGAVAAVGVADVIVIPEHKAVPAATASWPWQRCMVP